MAATVGTLFKFGIGSTSTVDKPIEVISGDVTKKRQISGTNGIRGTRSHLDERTRAMGYTVDGSLTMSPSPVELDTLLRYATGTAKDGSSQFPLAETIEDFYLSVDRIVKVYTYAGCKIAQFKLSASENQLMQCQATIMGKTETVANAGTYPSLTLDTGRPYCFYDAAVTIGGTTYSVKDWEVTIDNGLQARNFNSATRTEIYESDRTVSVRMTVPYTSTEHPLYDTTTTSAAVVITITNGTVSLTLSMAKVQFDTDGAAFPGKSEVTLQLSGQARKSGSTAELVITNDSTA